MAKLSKPSRPKGTKGEPPQSTDTLDLPNNLSRLEGGALKDLSFKVPVEFHRELKSFGAAHGRSMRSLLEEGFDLIKAKYGNS